MGLREFHYVNLRDPVETVFLVDYEHSWPPMHNLAVVCALGKQLGLKRCATLWVTNRRLRSLQYGITLFTQCYLPSTQVNVTRLNPS